MDEAPATDVKSQGLFYVENKSDRSPEDQKLRPPPPCVLPLLDVCVELPPPPPPPDELLDCGMVRLVV